jgi:hypothetical protein
VETSKASSKERGIAELGGLAIVDIAAVVGAAEGSPKASSNAADAGAVMPLGGAVTSWETFLLWENDSPKSKVSSKDFSNLNGSLEGGCAPAAGVIPMA